MGKLQALDKNVQNTLLMQEFEKLLIECNIKEQISEEMILCLIRAGMVLTNVSVWKTFATARDSCYDIGNTMKYTRKTALITGLNEKQTKNKRVTNTGLKKSGKQKFFSNIKLKTSNPVTFKNKSLSSKYKSNADSYEERKRSGLVDVGINLDLECNLDKSFDSQDTISEEMTETEFSDVMSKPKSEKGKRRIVRTSSDSEDFIHPTVMKSHSVHKMLKHTSKKSLCSDSSLELKSQGNVQPVFKSIWDTNESEKASTKPSQDFSDNTCTAQSSSSRISQKTISAKDNESFNNIFTNTITATTLSPMLNNMGADKGTNTRSLRPREHMDKLSEYISNT